MPERFECTTLAKKRYINTLTLLSFYSCDTWVVGVICIRCDRTRRSVYVVVMVSVDDIDHVQQRFKLIIVHWTTLTTSSRVSNSSTSTRPRGRPGPAEVQTHHRPLAGATRGSCRCGLLRRPVAPRPSHLHQTDTRIAFTRRQTLPHLPIVLRRTNDLTFSQNSNQSISVPVPYDLCYCLMYDFKFKILRQF